MGAISGASLGGIISDAVGWQLCFLAQVPVALAVWAVAGMSIKPQELVVQTVTTLQTSNAVGEKSKRQQGDLAGAALLFGGLVL